MHSVCVQDLDLKGKTVFLRVDFNVPQDENQNIRDDTRIRAALPTIIFLLEKGTKLIVASHLGRPEGKPIPELSMKPVAERLSELIPADVLFTPAVCGKQVDRIKRDMTENQVLVLENLRFNPTEKTNDDGFAAQLAQDIDIFVNDAFGSCHRAHASVVAITNHVKTVAAGFLVQKEIEYLDKVVRSPRSPYVAILGGAKVSDKIPIIRNLLNKADIILIGGAMAYTFFAALGKGIGRSLVEEDKIGLALELISLAKKKKVRIELPQDHILAPSMGAPEKAEVFDRFPFPEDRMGLDIGPRTREVFADLISSAQTILWNGPMGVFEIDEFSKGTVSIARSVAASQAISIVGGGDSVAAIAKAGVGDRISHISTGGGASLEYISNETLPGLEVLTK